jgi:hypothetical protein
VFAPNAMTISCNGKYCPSQQRSAICSDSVVTRPIGFSFHNTPVIEIKKNPDLNHKMP